jgi:hypothetical protein
MAEHDALRLLVGRPIGLSLEALQHHADQRSHAEICRPRVGAGEAELGQLVFDFRQEAGVVTATALSVLPAVRVPSIWGERAVPAIGLFVTGLEERSDGLIARVAPAAAVQIDERR